MDGGAWWATVHGVAKIWTQLNGFTSLHKVVNSHSLHVLSTKDIVKQTAGLEIVIDSLYPPLAKPILDFSHIQPALQLI